MEHQHNLRWRRLSATSIALVALALITPLFFVIPISHDAAWQMWIGRQLWFGRHLYSDIIEVNPPLWFWIATPLSGLATELGVRSLGLLATFFICSVATSVWLSSHLLGPMPEERRRLFLLAMLVACLPITDFGQREQFTLIASIPYALLIARRRDGSSVSASLAVAVGLFAAVGLALKPHFVILPLALELWLRRSLWRPETIVLGALAAIYAAAVIVLTPAYLTSTMPLVAEAYSSFGDSDASAFVWTGSVFMFALPVLTKQTSSTVTSLSIAALGFFLAFLLQAKGFAYHAIPSRGILLLALAASRFEERIYVALAFAAALITISLELGPYQNAWNFDVPQGASFAALSTQPRATWPEVEEHHRRWPLRVMSLWMAKGVHDLRPMQAMVAHDFGCAQPDYLLVDDRVVNFTALFPQIVAAYHPLWSRYSLTWMHRATALPKPPSCGPIY